MILILILTVLFKTRTYVIAESVASRYLTHTLGRTWMRVLAVLAYLALASELALRTWGKHHADRNARFSLYHSTPWWSEVQYTENITS